MSPEAQGGGKEGGGPAPQPEWRMYYGPPMIGVLSKRGIVVIIGFGLFLVWIGTLIAIADPGNVDLARFAGMLQVTGALLALLAALAGGLGAQGTSEWQNFGLLVFAGLLAVAMAIGL